MRLAVRCGLGLTCAYLASVLVACSMDVAGNPDLGDHPEQPQALAPGPTRTEKALDAGTSPEMTPRTSPSFAPPTTTAPTMPVKMPAPAASTPPPAADAGPLDPNAGVACGATRCAGGANALCCLTSTGSTCTAAVACPGARLECDDPSDCVGAGVCCARTPGGVLRTRCETNCRANNGREVCQRGGANTCRDDERCAGDSASPIGVCAD